MKKGLAKFSIITDPNDNNRTVVFRSQYPKYIVELFSKKPELEAVKIHLHDLDYYAVVLKDLDNNGPIPESYLKEIVRWWYYVVEEFETITLPEIESQLPESNEADLKSLFEFINGAYVAQDCFNKDRTWLYQRLNGNIVNGKPAKLKQEEIDQLADYLLKKADEMRIMANYLKE